MACAESTAHFHTAHPDTVRAAAREAYVWGWPLAFVHHCRSRIRLVTTAGKSGGLPVAPLNELAMLTDHAAPQTTLVPCPNRDVLYGFGIFDLAETPVVLQVPYFGNRFWLYQLGDQRTDGFADFGSMHGTRPGCYLVVGPGWTGAARALAELEEVLHDEIRRDRLATRRLRRLVAFAAARSPFYRCLYEGIDLRRFRLEDLPPVTKETLREHFDDVLTDPLLEQSDLADFVNNPANLGRWYRGRYAVSHTSGSQGPPLFIVQDRAAIELLFSLMSARANAGTKPGPLDGLRRLREPARVAVVALHRGFYPSSSAFEFMAAETALFTRVRWFSIADPDLVPQLADFQPHSLVAYASVLEGLALEAAFGVTVMDHYGTGECLFLSDGCPTDGGAHVNADWAILENVDDDNRPVPPGQPGRKVLVTNLANRVQPFIRYEVPDRIVMATEPCRCGSRLPRIARIEGRSAEAFWITAADGRQWPMPGVLFHDAIDGIA